jgi:hypothetical protein
MVQRRAVRQRGPEDSVRELGTVEAIRVLRSYPRFTIATDTPHLVRHLPEFSVREAT